jgi:regulatory protein
MNNTYIHLLAKAERFCAYQERCREDVKQKMKKLGADAHTIEKIISALEENDFLNDERFARLFASGKFRIKKWGRNKIRAALKMKKISNEYIEKGLNYINEKDYLNTLRELVRKKEKEIKNQEPGIRRMKIIRYLLSKGFEEELIWEVL